MEINAVTLVVTDMERSVEFYLDLGFQLAFGGTDAGFSTMRIGANFVNLQYTGEAPGTGWGRVIFFVDDPDELHTIAAIRGHAPEFAPRDAEWNERFFHIHDPDGHELSFARPL